MGNLNLSTEKSELKVVRKTGLRKEIQKIKSRKFAETVNSAAHHWPEENSSYF